MSLVAFVLNPCASWLRMNSTKLIRKSVPLIRFNCNHVTRYLFSTNSSVPRRWKAISQDDSEQDIDFSKLNPDKFGDLYAQSRAIKDAPLKSDSLRDDPDGYDELTIKRGPKKSMAAYERIIKEEYYRKPRDIRKLLKLHREYIYEDRYIPPRTFYLWFINACAQVGYTKKAIELLHEMKRFDLTPTKGTVTALFNACANCTGSTEYGLEQTKKLREYFELSGYEFNDIHYNAIIKAFAKLGDMKSAYHTLDVMKEKGHDTSLETYSMLLMGCIADRQNGLVHGVDVWNRILESNQQLQVHVFNLFLRCIRDCRIESEKSLLKLCKQGVKNRRMLDSRKKIPLLERKKSGPESEISTEVSLSEKLKLPNLLTGENLDQIVSIDFNSLAYSRNRFLLFGGAENFLQLMQSYQVKPNMKTITLIVELLQAEECLETTLNILDQLKLKPDIFLFNVIMKKVGKQSSPEKCKLVLAAMHERNIKPDIMTFGALAFACRSMELGRQILLDMKACGVAPNQFILGTLINNACFKQDLYFLNFLLDYIHRTNFQMSLIDFEQIQLCLDNVKQDITSLDRNNVAISSVVVNDYERARIKFQRLSRQTSIEPDTHVWKQFESEDPEPQKEKFNTVVKYMKKKIDVKMGREETIPDYNDEIDDE